MKIAILGSAPSSLPLAPFKNPEWEIWGCSPGCAHFIRTNGHRIDRWFEIHHFIPPANEFNPDYIAWMKSLAPKPVYMIKAVEPIPNSVPYPKNKMVEEFGPFFWQGSPSYMLALAISIRGVKEIGLWGIDMSHVSEWAQQRPCCQHYIQVAWDRGIKVSTPPQSDILWPSPMYGYHETGPRAIKAYARQKEMSAKLAEAEAKHAQAEREMFFMKGVCDSNQYFLNNLPEEPDWTQPPTEWKSDEPMASGHLTNGGYPDNGTITAVVDDRPATDPSRQRGNGLAPMQEQSDAA